jgi:hypothetical protein
LFTARAAKETGPREPGDYRSFAFFSFGMAMHPIMDAWSPTHQWQVYGLSGLLPLDGFRMIKHMRGESGRPTDAQMEGMKSVIQIYYLNTFVAKIGPRETSLQWAGN